MAPTKQQEPDIFGPGSEEGSEAVLPSTTALGQLEESALNSLIKAARQAPRSITKFREELKAIVTTSPEIAQQMTYSLPRADKQLIGPSIRFAEAVMYCWRNLAVEVRPLEVGDDSVTAQAQIFDLERLSRFGWNTSRNITGKYGRFNADMIGVTMAAASSLAYRNAILKYVPKALWIGLWEESKLASVGKIEAIGAQRDKAITHFNNAGVTTVQILNALGIPGVEDVGVDELVTLRAWANDLKDGRQSVEAIFGSVFDEEIEKTMKALGWNATKQRLSRENFAGNPEGHVQHLRTEAKKLGVEVELKKGAEPSRTETAGPTTESQPASKQAIPVEESKPTPTAAQQDTSAGEMFPSESASTPSAPSATTSGSKAEPSQPQEKKEGAPRRRAW